MNEIDKFFSGLPTENKQMQEIVEDPTKIAVPVQGEPKQKVEGDEGEEPRKNRRHRRLEEQLQRERESSIALNERVKVLSEMVVGGGNTPVGEIPGEWIALYGNTDEAKNAWAMQERLLQQATQRAKQEAIEEMQQQQFDAQQQQKDFESFIDTELENLEDTYNVDLTSNAPAARKARRELLEMVQQLSPKDEDGTILNFADFGSTFDVYQKTQTEDKSEITNKKKEIAAKSMQNSGNNTVNPQQPTPGFRGWMKDYGVN